MINTGLRANKKQETHTITFKNKTHENFYNQYLLQCRYQNIYYKVLLYCLGIDEDTRRNIKSIYDFKTGCVKPECLQEGWITNSSAKVVRMAFNLYNNRTVWGYLYQELSDQEQKVDMK